MTEGHYNGWIGVDLDATLAQYHGWQGPEHIGEPIPKMVNRVKKMLAEGKDVRIFTARVYHDGTPDRMRDVVTATKAIRLWSLENLGAILPITCTKDYGMIQLWDDRAVQVIPNTGIRVDSLVQE